MELLIKYRVFVIFLVLFAVMAIFSDSFLTRGNILNMLRQLSITEEDRLKYYKDELFDIDPFKN